MLRSLQKNPYLVMDDPALIKSCLSGEAKAWDALVDRYARLVYSVCRRAGLSSADTEDIFQNVCVILYQHLGDLKNTSRLSSWLILTTKREAWRHTTRRGATLSVDLPGGDQQLEQAAGNATDPFSFPEEITLVIEEQQLMRQAMQQLQEPCRNLLLLLFCHEPPCSYTEAAQRLNLPVGSIGPNRARCLQRLHKLLDEVGF